MLEETNPDEIDDNFRMSLYTQVLLLEYHNALSEELAKQGIII